MTKVEVNFEVVITATLVVPAENMKEAVALVKTRYNELALRADIDEDVLRLPDAFQLEDFDYDYTFDLEN